MEKEVRVYLSNDGRGELEVNLTGRLNGIYRGGSVLPDLINRYKLNALAASSDRNIFASCSLVACNGACDSASFAG